MGYLANYPNPTQAQLGGGAFPSQMRSVELLLDREGTFPWAGARPGSLLIHSLTVYFSKNGSFPAEGYFQPRVVSGQELFPARGCFQPGAVSSQGLVTILKDLFPNRVCSTEWRFPFKALFLPRARSNDRLINLLPRWNCWRVVVRPLSRICALDLI